MSKYYTRACNFYYGKTSLEMLKKKKAFPLNGNKEVSFDTIEILSRKDKKKIKIDKIKSLNNSNIEGVIIGKSIYDGDIKINELAKEI